MFYMRFNTVTFRLLAYVFYCKIERLRLKDLIDGNLRSHHVMGNKIWLYDLKT